MPEAKTERHGLRGDTNVVCVDMGGMQNRHKWCPQAGSNHRPFAYEASALPLSYRGYALPYAPGHPDMVPTHIHLHIHLFYQLALSIHLEQDDGRQHKHIEMVYR